LEPVAQSPEGILRRVELRISRRFDGLLQGERRGRRAGPGADHTVTRPYEPGDDVRWLDWPLTARTGEPMVRVPELEPVLTAWALVDASASMAFGTVRTTKLELAREVLAGLGVVLRKRGDRLGLAVTQTGALDVVKPPRGDRRGLLNSLHTLENLVPLQDGTRMDLAAAVRKFGRVVTHRSLVVILSDFPMQPGLEQALGALSRRHELMLIELRDPRERELPVMGPITLRDVESGRRVLVDTADPKFRERFATLSAQRDAERLAMFRRVNARHVIASTDRDWVLPLAKAIGGNRPARRAM
jgi:uncharacterized protein (DUF58 family)